MRYPSCRCGVPILLKSRFTRRINPMLKLIWFAGFVSNKSMRVNREIGLSSVFNHLASFLKSGVTKFTHWNQYIEPYIKINMTDSELLTEKHLLQKGRKKQFTKCICTTILLVEKHCSSEQRDHAGRRRYAWDAGDWYCWIICRKENFILTCTPTKTLLFAIARRLWLKHLRDRSINETLTELEIEQQDFVAQWEEIEKSEHKYDSIPQVLSRISVHCSGLLKQLFPYWQDPRSL